MGCTARWLAGLDDLVTRLQAFTIALARNGIVQARGAGRNVLDSPLLAALHLRRVLKDHPMFEPIRGGEIVTTGTLTSALPIQSGETWATNLSGIDLPGVTIQFD